MLSLQKPEDPFLSLKICNMLKLKVRSLKIEKSISMLLKCAYIFFKMTMEMETTVETAMKIPFDEFQREVIDELERRVDYIMMKSIE